MNDDDQLCLCFHISRRKIKNFIKIERPRVASQISECGGAGTGCGWCRPMLRRLLEEAQGQTAVEPWPDTKAYAAGRDEYRKKK